MNLSSFSPYVDADGVGFVQQQLAEWVDAKGCFNAKVVPFKRDTARALNKDRLLIKKILQKPTHLQIPY